MLCLFYQSNTRLIEVNTSKQQDNEDFVFLCTHLERIFIGLVFFSVKNIS